MKSICLKFRHNDFIYVCNSECKAATSPGNFSKVLEFKDPPVSPTGFWKVQFSLPTLKHLKKLNLHLKHATNTQLKLT